MEKEFSISFDYVSSELTEPVHLNATVKQTQQENCFFISKIGSSSNTELQPGITIMKVGENWVHKDSGKETLLSIAIGKAIDSCYEQIFILG